jgi:hypothetical protein
MLATLPGAVKLRSLPLAARVAGKRGRAGRFRLFGDGAATPAALHGRGCWPETRCDNGYRHRGSPRSHSMALAPNAEAARCECFHSRGGTRKGPVWGPATRPGVNHRPNLLSGRRADRRPYDIPASHAPRRHAPREPPWQGLLQPPARERPQPRALERGRPACGPRQRLAMSHTRHDEHRLRSLPRKHPKQTSSPESQPAG